MIVWHNVEQGSSAWKRLRQGLWTGTTAIRLLQGKPLLPESDWNGNNATRRGHALETVAIREYERKYKTKVQRPGFVTNPVYPNAGYSPDGIDGPWLLEVKAFSGKRHQDLTIGVFPVAILVQIFFGMIITGKRKARLLAFNPEYEEQLIVIEIEYDKAIGTNIRKKLFADMKKRRLNEAGATDTSA